MYPKQCVTRRDSKWKVEEKSYVAGTSGCPAAAGGECKSTLCKLKSMCADKMPRREQLSSKWAQGWIWLMVILLALSIVSHFGLVPTGGCLVCSARIEGRRISYFLGKTWRKSIGISSSNYTYPGITPPYATGSICSNSSSEVAGAARPPRTKAGRGPQFDVCVSVSIGDDGGQPQDQALPYQLVHSRIFEALDEEIEATMGRKTREVQVLLGVDYGSIVCKMLRDHVDELPGVKAQCTTFEQIPHGTKCSTLVSGVTTRFVPQVPESFRNAVGWKTQRFVDLDCSNPAQEAPSLPEKLWRPTIVTGFSSNHMTVGLLMLRSVGKAAKEGASNLYNISVVVWIMDVLKPEDQRILDCVIDELNTEYHITAEARFFDFSVHPKWMRLNQTLGYFRGTGEYAWKAVMLHTLLRERGMVVWADAGDRFENTASLVETLSVLESTGFVSRKSHGTIWTRTHPLHLKFFRADLPGIWDLENCEAAIIGFTLKKYKEIARPWYECSIIKQCIAPDGSDRSNHRQDQAALSVLSILSGNPCEGAHPSFGHHMDDDPIDSPMAVRLGVDPSHCYVDPLQLDLPQGTYLDHRREGPYIWN